MTVTIYGFPESTYVQTVRLVCLEKGLDHVLTMDSMQEWVSAPDVKAKTPHPFGKVPAIRHGDHSLFETSAICRFLDEVGDGVPLFGRDTWERAQVEQWISAINGYLYDALIRKFVLVYAGAKYFGRSLDRDALDGALPAIRKHLALLDDTYGDRDYLAGESLSAADLFLAPLIAYLSGTPEGPDLLGEASNVRRAHDVVAQRKNYASILPG